MALTLPGLLVLLPDGMRTVLAPHGDRGHIRAPLFLGGIRFGPRLRPDPPPGPVRPESPVPAWRWFVIPAGWYYSALLSI